MPYKVFSKPPVIGSRWLFYQMVDANTLDDAVKAVQGAKAGAIEHNRYRIKGGGCIVTFRVWGKGNTAQYERMLFIRVKDS